MKKAERRLRLRWVAGGLYGLFGLLQMLCLQYTLQTVSLFSMPTVTFLEVCTLFLSGVAVVYIFSVQETKPVIGRAVPVITLLYGIYQLLFYQAQLVPLQLSFSLLSVPVRTSEILQNVCIGLRIVLVAVAAVLIYYSITPFKAPAEEQNEDKRGPSNPEGRKPMSKREERQTDKTAAKAPPKKNQPVGAKQQTKAVYKATKK